MKRSIGVGIKRPLFAASLALATAVCSSTSSHEPNGTYRDPLTITFLGPSAASGNSTQQDRSRQEAGSRPSKRRSPGIKVKYVDIAYDSLLPETHHQRRR